jgi:hypothetical protein
MEKLPEFRSFLELAMDIQEPWHTQGILLFLSWACPSAYHCIRAQLTK